MTRDERLAYTYFLLNKKLRVVKIGSTINHNARLVHLRTTDNWARDAKFIGFLHGGLKTERFVQGELGNYRIDRSEWFRFTPTVRKQVDFYVDCGDLREIRKRRKQEGAA